MPPKQAAAFRETRGFGKGTCTTARPRTRSQPPGKRQPQTPLRQTLLTGPLQRRASGTVPTDHSSSHERVPKAAAGDRTPGELGTAVVWCAVPCQGKVPGSRMSNVHSPVQPLLPSLQALPIARHRRSSSSESGSLGESLAPRRTQPQARSHPGRDPLFPPVPPNLLIRHLRFPHPSPQVSRSLCAWLFFFLFFFFFFLPILFL